MGFGRGNKATDGVQFIVGCFGRVENFLWVWLGEKHGHIEIVIWGNIIVIASITSKTLNFTESNDCIINPI